VSSSIPTLPAIQNGIDAVEKLMLSQAENYHPDLCKALSLLLSSGGKRIRPRIILLIGSMFNAPKENLIRLAASIELLHTATLVHDDLIDEALFRRGVPTLNSKWSPAATVLTGDFVFASAAHLASLTNSIEVMALFSKTLQTIVNGEVNQLFSSRCNRSKDDYYRRIYAKTASLFETSTHTAGIISQVSNQQVELLRKFGYEIGMAFQIIDDILDYRGEQSIIGKPVGGDLQQGLFTLPFFYYIEMNESDKEVETLLNGNCPFDEASVQDIVTKIAESKAIDKSYNEAVQFCERAELCLRQLPQSPECNELSQITSYIVERNF
jgi:geranylgeranyl pyrophosphate synthase